ncbi:MAG: L-serine ammonia-lyase, iron-sulfur-dependent, subunit alpha [Erysipelotrichaceae bacterium]|nr:L-serine ammonia-lyase, iron-sulfur-dependent, subunit alpha [Erysipelotrichaceae bacterium]
MQAIKQLYKIGYGPSSSHTIAPYRLMKLYKEYYPETDHYEITLGGSIALTGKGHATDKIIERALESKDIDFRYVTDIKDNLINVKGYNGNKEYPVWHGKSLGGGAISVEEIHVIDEDEVYKENDFVSIKKYLSVNKCSLLEYVYKYEPDLKEHLNKCIDVIIETVEEGLRNEGVLNEKLNYSYIAKELYEKAESDRDYLMAYSYAACEQNASGRLMVTSPTLGASGIISALVYYLKINKKYDNDLICDFLAVAGVFGNCIKHNASIAGSIGGCQAEIGTACSMASAGLSYLKGYDLESVEYAAEMGVEHFLGLTCDPVLGYVIIPCIERNAIGLLKAIDCSYLAGQLNNVKKNVISFDSVVKTMNYTGKKIAVELRETSLGGLSKEYVEEKA